MAHRETTQEETKSSSQSEVLPVLSRSFSDPDELVEGIPEIDGEFVQVSPGAFRAQVLGVELDRVTLHQTYSLPKTLSEMAIDDSTLVVGMSLQCDGPLLVQGKVLEPSKVFFPGREFVRQALDFRGLWIGLRREQVESTVCALLGVDEIRLPGGFLVGHEGLERSLVATMAAQADVMLREPEHFADPSARHAVASEPMASCEAVAFDVGWNSCTPGQDAAEPSQDSFSCLVSRGARRAVRMCHHRALRFPKKKESAPL